VNQREREREREREKIMGDWRKNNYMMRVFLIIGVMFSGWKGKYSTRHGGTCNIIFEMLEGQ
jgi:hypothetical protein